MDKLKQISILMIFFLLMFTGEGYVPKANAAAADYVNVNRTVNPTSIITEGEAEVSLNIQGTPPVNIVKPNDVILVIDKSGSMTSENKMANAREAAKGFIDLMNLNIHRVGIVDFSSQSNVGLFPLGTDALTAKNYISGINSNGGTGTGAAIDKAMLELQNVRDEAQPVIVILTDGDATEPSGNAYEYALQKANEAKEQGIVFYTIALLSSTDNPDTSKPNLLLKEMATTSSHHHFVLGSQGLSDIYAAIVQEIGIASAYDLTVTDKIASQFEIVPGSYENNIPKPVVDGNVLTWNFKELKDKNLVFTYKIRPTDKTKTGNFNVAASGSQITYKDYAGAIRTKSIPNANLQVKLPAPVVTSVDPAFGHPNGGNTITIIGQNFVDGATVTIGGKAAAVNYVDSGTLQVTVPSGAQGTAVISVANPDKQSATGEYKYQTEPIVTSITPNTGPFEGGNTIVIDGNYFMKGIQVYFGDKAAKVNINLSATYLTVTAPLAENSGPVDVKLVNPDGTQTVVSNGYIYQEKIVPKLEVTSITPSKGPTTGETTVYISGKLISPQVKIFFGSNEVTGLTYYNHQQIQVKSPSNSVAETVDVKLVNPDGQEAVLTQAFTYEEPPKLNPPSIASITPKEGVLAGGTSVYINGSNLVNGTKVFFGTHEATVILNTAGTSLMVTAPAGSADGLVDVSVILPDGQSATLASAFNYFTPIPDPIMITSITPNTGNVIGGEVAYIQGSNFKSGMTIDFGGVRGRVSQITNSSSASIIVPASSVVGAVDIVVTNTDGGMGTLPQGYTYVPVQPKITGLTPNKVVNNKGGTVYVSGEYFERTMTVTVGGVNVPISSYTNDKTFSFIAPILPNVGEVSVVLTLANGQTTTANLMYEAPVLAPAPVLTSMTYTSGKAAGGGTNYIYGRNFTPNTTIYFGSTKGTVTGNYGSFIQVKIPPGVAGETVQVQVFNNQGTGSNTLSYTYN
ncbi:IPT/TIG domain-containing protein [Paenibacillus sp. F411]|nr:IPT/TIG domain-containing protein [Paenibacillus sp. F411]